MRATMALVLVAVVATVLTKPAAAAEPVSIRIGTQVLTSPAYLRVLVFVEPDSANRLLTIELDGAPLFRSSDVALAGEREKRSHLFEVKGLMPGRYVVRAVLHGSAKVRAVRERQIVVVGPGGLDDDTH